MPARKRVMPKRNRRASPTVSKSVMFVGEHSPQLSPGLGIEILFSDAREYLARYGRRVFVDVMHAPLARSVRRIFHRLRRAVPFDRLDLVVHRAVRAVHGQLVPIERNRAPLSQSQIVLGL